MDVDGSGATVDHDLWTAINYETLREDILKNGIIPTMSKTKLIQKLKNMK